MAGTEKEMKMISIEESRPPIATKCLVFCKDKGYYFGFRANGGWYILVGDSKIYVANDEKYKSHEVIRWTLI